MLEIIGVIGSRRLNFMVLKKCSVIFNALFNWSICVMTNYYNFQLPCSIMRKYVYFCDYIIHKCYSVCML